MIDRQCESVLSCYHNSRVIPGVAPRNAILPSPRGMRLSIKSSTVVLSVIGISVANLGRHSSKIDFVGVEPFATASNGKDVFTNQSFATYRINDMPLSRDERLWATGSARASTSWSDGPYGPVSRRAGGECMEIGTRGFLAIAWPKMALYRLAMTWQQRHAHAHDWAREMVDSAYLGCILCTRAAVFRQLDQHDVGGEIMFALAPHYSLAPPSDTLCSYPPMASLCRTSSGWHHDGS